MTTEKCDGGAGGAIALIMLAFIFPGLFIGVLLFLGAGRLFSGADGLFEDPDPLRTKGGVSTLTGTLIILATIGLVAAVCFLPLIFR